MTRRIAALLLLLTTAAFAQSPTPEQFLGYKLGDRFTQWPRIVEYFDALAKSSNLITVQQFGETYEHRPLILAVITSPKNRAQLDAVRANVVSLANGSVSAERAAEIAKSNPAVAWLAFGVHGNESSSAEAAMAVASTLVNDPASAAMLDNLVVVIDPLLNPDGRERYIQWFVRTRGTEPNPNPDAFEHTEPWPGGRFNHYLIDMNRDWAWSSQRETRARIAAYRQWMPQVFVDFHEMFYNSTYFFPPDAKPINVNLPKDVNRWLEVFGRANAEAFTKNHWPFFVGETFDLFYPGYGDSWPSLHGAIGMTYEVAGHSRAGTSVLRDDGDVYTLADRIARHTTSGLTTLRTAAAHREELLRYTYEAARTQLAAPETTYLLAPGAPGFQALVEALQRQGIDVGTLSAPVTVKATRVDSGKDDSRTFPAGTAAVSTRQAQGGLVQTLLERTPVFTKGFLEEQRQRAQEDEPDQFYDLTAWSLPLAMNVEAWSTGAPVAGVKPLAPRARPAFRAASYGYLVDGDEPNVYRVAGRMLRDDVKFNVSEDPIVVGERTYARGTIVVLKGNNKSDVDAALERIGRDEAVAFVPVETGWIGGTAFGSERIHFVKDPKIALVGGNGTDATSYGMLWHTLDVDTPIPHTTISMDALRNTDFGHYRVIVLPNGGAYHDRLGKGGIEKLKAWINGGGTLVAIKNAGGFLREKDVEISKAKLWEPPKKKDDDKSPPAEERYHEYSVPGAAFRTKINERSFFTFGVPRPPFVLLEGSEAVLPVSHRVDNVVTIDKNDPLAAGVAWPESLDRLKGSAYMIAERYGRGYVVTFADEPHFRLFWRGTLPLFLNTVLYAPSFPHD
jgi:Zinc carboxypeptidase